MKRKETLVPYDSPKSLKELKEELEKSQRASLIRKPFAEEIPDEEKIATLEYLGLGDLTKVPKNG